MLARFLRAAAGAAARRPLRTLTVAGLLGLVAGVAALGLQPSSATDTLVSSSSSTYRDTTRFYRSFGTESIVVMIRGPLSGWLFSSDLDRELGLEGCLSGSVSGAALSAHGGADGPCGVLARTKPVKVVFGPGTFINESAVQIGDEFTSEVGAAQQQAASASATVKRAALARGLGSTQASKLGNEASELILSQFEQQLVGTGLQYGLTSLPTIDSASFVSRLVCANASATNCTPKPRFAYLFPNADTSIVTVRLKPSLSETQQNAAIAEIRRAVAMPDWAPRDGESYLVTGEPVIVADLTGAITSSLRVLLLVGLLVMAATLALVFQRRPRLLPLAVALVATALTFGALALAGASITMASVGVLPVLLGLAVDYGVQFQSRVAEEMEATDDPAAAIDRGAALGGPTIVTAAAATAGGFLVLLLSPVPMVRGFGLLLVLGIALSLLCTFTVGSAALARFSRTAARRPGRPHRAPGPVALALEGAREIVRDNRVFRGVRQVAWRQALGHPERVLAVGLVLAVAGWGLDTQTSVQTDVTKLVPQNLASLRNLSTLEADTGVGGEIDVMVSAPNLATARVVNWMSAYERSVLAHYGYSETAAARGCGHVPLCPAFSLPDLFSSDSGGAPAPITDASVQGVLAAVPSYLSQGVITPDRRTATLAFGIREMPLARQEQVVDTMRRLLHPPAGVQASLVGLPVLAAQANADVSSPSRRLLTLLAGLLAVALVLLVAFRGDRRRTLLPLVPIVLASGWSALVLFLVRVPLNPMSVTMGALVIAISTEFSVLLSERYRQERADGSAAADALARTYRRTGAAVGASGATAIAGFAVLMCSNISMLRDFGLVTVIDLSVSLAGVLVVLPAVLLLAERGELAWPARGRCRRAASRRPGLGGSARHEPA